ncbi:hypothetical protein AGR1B_Cc120460 [Agrobacterium fabacearum S56]|nr:hypothetical protein AGR1B_Cc120460 [Agrobacterium fabacearum S56]
MPNSVFPAGPCVFPAVSKIRTICWKIWRRVLRPFQFKDSIDISPWPNFPSGHGTHPAWVRARVGQPIFTFTVIPNGEKTAQQKMHVVVKSFIFLTIARTCSVG